MLEPKLKAELPMTSRMYVMLVNKVAQTTLKCGLCNHHNGECIDFAKAGCCKAIDKSLNDILVFHDGYYEFATTRRAIAHALEVNQDNDLNPWIGETVDAVIEDYLKNNEFGKENSVACDLYELLSDSDILAKVYWEE